MERNKEVVRKQHSEVWSKGNLQILEELYTPNFVGHIIVGDDWGGYDGLRKQVTSHRISFPDWTEEIVDMIAEGDRVVSRFKSYATHLGEFNAIAPTGRKIEIFEVAFSGSKTAGLPNSGFSRMS